MSVERKQSQEHNDLALASGQLSWWDTVRHHGYYYREVAVATLIFGIYLHVSRLVFGDELLLRYLLQTGGRRGVNHSDDVRGDRWLRWVEAAAIPQQSS